MMIGADTKKKKPPRGGFSIHDQTGSHLAGRVGIVSAAISSVSSGTDRSSSDAHRHSTAYGCTTVDATAIDTNVVNANATNSNASSVCEGVS
jgi:hypothetical protein